MTETLRTLDGPKRIQRKRTKGWKMPAGAIYVGRPTKWGNPFQVGTTTMGLNRMTREQAVAAYRVRVGSNPLIFPTKHEIRDELRGKDLACWCPLDQPCHADVLLEIANA